MTSVQSDAALGEARDSHPSIEQTVGAIRESPLHGMTQGAANLAFSGSIG
ncbi:hypothetical protein ACP6PL_20500 [Dapis sp. BLCC M126]